MAGQDPGELLEALRLLIAAPDTRMLPGELPTLYRRLARAFEGDPVLRVTGSSTGSGNVQQLPDHPYPLAAKLYVVAGPVIVRLDGQPPVAGVDQSVPQGSIIELTGQASIKGFQWASGGAFTTTLTGHYFD